MQYYLPSPTLPSPGPGAVTVQSPAQKLRLGHSASKPGLGHSAQKQGLGVGGVAYQLVLTVSMMSEDPKVRYYLFC